MTADIVNLRQVRKQKARAEKERHSEAKRAKHGQTKATRRHEAANKALEKKRLDGLVRIQPDANGASNAKVADDATCKRDD